MATENLQPITLTYLADRATGSDCRAGRSGSSRLNHLLYYFPNMPELTSGLVGDLANLLVL